MELTAEIARELLRYEPETGKLFWKFRSWKWFSRDQDWKRWNNRFSGKEAFTANRNGYKTGGVFDKRYSAHRMIWLMQTGSWPKDDIDHINHVRSDNQWGNLRAVTRQENMRNSSMNANNTSGVVGVSWHKQANKPEAYIEVDGKRKYLGIFSSHDDAIAARKAAEIKYGYHENHGTSI